MPALAVAREIRSQAPSLRLLYIGAPGSIEEKLAKAEKVPFEAVSISPLRRGVIIPNLLVPLQAATSMIRAMWILKKQGAIGVFGSGGFSSWPATAAARQLRLPYFLEDGNAYPGIVTRLLARRASRLFLAYEETAKHLRAKPSQTRLTGVPVSNLVGKENLIEARRELGLDEGRLTILATGGSGGAKTINRAIGEAKEELLRRGYNLIWQTGKQLETLPEVEPEFGKRMIIERFLDPVRMAQAIRACDIAVTRCGMMSLAELAVAGKPAILVPFPHSAEGHQEANACAVEAAGGGRYIRDADFEARSLLEALTEMESSEVLQRMATAQRALAKPNAAKEIAKDILDYLGQSGDGEAEGA